MTRKTFFFKEWSSSKFNNLGLALGKNLKFFTSVAKKIKLEVRKFLRLISTFVKVVGEKLVGGLFASPPSPIVNRVKRFYRYCGCFKTTTQTSIFSSEGSAYSINSQLPITTKIWLSSMLLLFANLIVNVISYRNILLKYQTSKVLTIHGFLWLLGF